MANSYDIADQITSALKEYSNEVVRLVNVSSDSCAKALRDELIQTSPKKTGRYAQGWRIKSGGTSKNALARRVVYNATDYQLTHLLEYGHAVNGGTRRVKAYPHIAPAEEHAVNNFAEQVEKAIREAGK